MKREYIERLLLLVVTILAIIGLNYKNKEIERLQKRQSETLTERNDYKWKYEHLEYICDLNEK